MFRRAFFLTLLGTSAFAADSSLRDINPVFIGSMGQSDEAERFRMLIEERLNKVGLQTTNQESQAKTILSGILVVRVHAEGTTARATVALKAKDGRTLWGGDFGPRAGFSRKDSVQRRADDIVKALANATKK